MSGTNTATPTVDPRVEAAVIDVIRANRIKSGRKAAGLIQQLLHKIKELKFVTREMVTAALAALKSNGKVAAAAGHLFIASPA